MALMLGKLYDALRAGNVPEKEAREASEEVASYERDIAGIRTEVRGVQGLAGVIVVVLFAVLWQLVALGSGLARLDERVAGQGAQIDKRLGTIEQRLDGVDQRLGAVERRLPSP